MYANDWISRTLKLEFLKARALTCEAFESTLRSKGVIQQDIAEYRMAFEQARLLVLSAAHAMDSLGAKQAREHI